MKRSYIVKSMLMVLAMFSLTNCSDQLDEEQELVVVQDDLDYSSQEAALGALIGAYQKFQDVGWEQIPLLAVRGDDVNAGGKGDQQGFADTDNYIYDSNFWMYNSLWQTWFQDVLQITAQMEQLQAFKAGGVKAELVDQYIAECRVLRGFITLELSHVFGDVYKIESTDQTQIKVLPKNELMQWISDEMDLAIPHLVDMHPNKRTDLRGGVTKYTGLTVKAMANLDNENYQAVADAAGEIIKSNKFKLSNDFYNLFKIPGKLDDENILEIQYSDFGQGSGLNISHLYAFYGPQSWTPAVAGAGAGWGFYEPSKKYIKFMLDRNETIRLETSVLFTDRGINELKSEGYTNLPDFVKNTTRSGDVIKDYSRALFASGKHYLPSNQLTPGRTSYGTNKNYTVIRYAEVLLMYAEALTRGATGTAGTAVEAVNKVRERANLNALSSVTNEDVLDEKFAELAMEWGVRYNDMIRLKKTDELSYDGRTFDMSKAYLPYPQAQLDQSYILNAYYQNKK